MIEYQWIASRLWIRNDYRAKAFNVAPPCKSGDLRLTRHSPETVPNS
jgi:hypothetical protein